MLRDLVMRFQNKSAVTRVPLPDADDLLAASLAFPGQRRARFLLQGRDRVVHGAVAFAATARVEVA